MTAIPMQALPTEDADLVSRSLAGDQLAFQDLVERYQERVFALVRHYAKTAVEVEDIVQDTFLKVFCKLGTFNHDSSFYTWLCRIAINTALDFLKRHGRNPVQSVEDVETAQASARPARVQAPDARLHREEVATITHAVLAELPEIFRTVLVLREFEERSYQEMADTLGISIGTVESRLFRARARFRDKLAQMHPEFAAPE